MGLTYFKRYRMEIGLSEPIFAPPPLPEGYELCPWHENLLEAHTEAKYHSFRGEIDANVFPCFHDREGCDRLMHEITERPGFVPQATWLLRYYEPRRFRGTPCGTIQGVWDPVGLGAVQNLGVTPEHRGRGFGTALLYAALSGFRAAGIDRVYLEVTAQNSSAVRLYERLGFRKVKTVYKAADVAPC